MKIKNKEYRIKEKVYKDGHKVYTAQVATNFYFFKIWNDFVSSVSDYGYGCIRWICCGNTYEDCKQHLLESLESQEKAKNKITIESINYMYD